MMFGKNNKKQAEQTDKMNEKKNLLEKTENMLGDDDLDKVAGGMIVQPEIKFPRRR